MFKINLLIKKINEKYSPIIMIGNQSFQIEGMVKKSDAIYMKNQIKKAFYLDCKHSYVLCQGLNGGHIFERCNKCGITKDKKKKNNAE
jgi:hypothetical protein